MKRTGRIRPKRRKSRVGKTGTIRLDAAGMAKLREAVYDRAEGLCEMPRGGRRCGRYAGWKSGQLAHYPRSRGAGAGDTMHETLWACFDCHHAQHNPKACPVKPGRHNVALGDVREA